MGVRDWSLRGLIHRLRGHEITLSPTLILVPAMWHNCSCGKRVAGMSNRETLDRLSDLFGWEEHDRVPVGLVVERVLGLECDECNGTGMTKQGWTDKSGFSEDQYGPCGSCVRRGQR